MACTNQWIGVCLSQAHTFLKTDFLVELDREARKDGYGIVVFNSSMDYYWAQNGNNATGCVYNLIRYDRLAALVILDGDLYDVRMQEEIIHRAGVQKVPVIWQGGIHDRCFSVPCDYKEAFKEIIRPVLSESCGCPKTVNDQIRTINTLQQSEMMYNVENTLFCQVDQMLVHNDLYDTLSRIGELILPDSAVYLNKSILNLNPDTEYQVDHPEDEMIMIPYCRPGEKPALRQVYLKDMPLPFPDEPGVTILNIVHAGDRVCGYYAAHSANLAANFRLIKRVSDVLNLVASIQLGRVWRRQLEARLENNLYSDFIAGLPNLKGLTR